jgi:hypothetical protein
MGGMGGGGMGGGMGGMRGDRGGMGRGGMGGSMKSPAELAKANLERSDPLAFLLEHKKPLALNKLQQDSVKTFRKEMQEKQAPLFKQLEKIFDDAPQAGRRGGGMGGGMGGGGMDPEGRGARGGRRGAPGDSARDSGRGALPDSVRTVLDRLTDIQDAYRDRARAQLDTVQRMRVDSIQNALLEKEREKARKQREERREQARERRRD